MRITIKKLLILTCYIMCCFISFFIMNKMIKSTRNSNITGYKNIFFLETSHLWKEILTLTPRQLCAVESAARMNPNMNIQLFIFSPASAQYSQETENIISLLTEYENINLEKIPINKFLEGTAIERWWRETDRFASNRWSMHRIVNCLKFLILWDFGGIYLDLDVVVQTSLGDLRNFVGAENSKSIGESAVGFDSSVIGIEYARMCLEESLYELYDAQWSYKTPSILSRFTQKMCGITNFDDKTDYICNNDTLMVFKPSTFYPIPIGMYKLYFDREKPSIDETMEAIKNAKTIHLWNEYSYSELVEVGSEAPYALIAKKYCPIAYNSNQYF